MGVRRRMLAALMALAMLIPAAPAVAEGETITLMVYMCGSNLESWNGAATADLLEMASAGHDPRRVNVLVMAGGTRRWEIGIPSDALCVYMPFRGSLRMLYAFEPMSMGSPDALTALLAYGYQSYPADRYALILWNHGGGPMNGVCWDELYGDDHLTMEELVTALDASPAANEKLEWIGFDACLMASAEVAALMEPYARYMIASEETEPGSGWNYDFLTALADDADGAATGRRVIDGYFDGTADDAGRTLACVDLSKIDALRGSMDAFFPKLDITGGSYALYAYAARGARAFGKAASSQDSYDLVDLRELTQRLSAQRPEDAGAVLKSLEDAVVYSRSGAGESGGLSVYHPCVNKAGYASAWNALYPALGFSNGYAEYVGKYAGYLFGQSGVSWEGLAVALTDDPDTYALPMTEEQRQLLSGAALNVLAWNEADDTYASLCSVTDVQEVDGVLYAAFPERYLSVVDGGGTPLTGFVPYEALPDGTFGVYVNWCTPEGAQTDEATARVDAARADDKKSGFGSYTFDLDEAGTSSLDTGAAGQTGTTGSAVDADGLTQAGTSSLAERYQQMRPTIVQVSPLSSAAYAGLTLTVPDSVSLALKGTAGLSVAAQLFAPDGAADVQIVPAYDTLTQTPDYTLTEGRAGTQLPLDSFGSIDVETFDPDQRWIDLTAELPPEEPSEAPQVIHAWLKCRISEDGGVEVTQTWLYDAETGEWSARGEIDRGAYPVAAFPISWRQTSGVEGGLAGFGEWIERYTTARTVTDGDWALAFVPAQIAGEKVCVSFEVTDAQNLSHSSVPMQRDQ